METSKDHKARHSEKDFAAEFLQLVDASAGVVHVRTNEIIRAVSVIRKTVLLDKGEYREWDVVNGNREFTLQNYHDDAIAGDGSMDVNDAFMRPLGVLRDARLRTSEATRYFVYVNPLPFIDGNPYLQHLLLMYNEFLPSARVCVVLVTSDTPLPECPAAESILSLHFDPPGAQELAQSLQSLLDSTSEEFGAADIGTEEIDHICAVGAGMSALMFETYVSLAATRASRRGESSFGSEDIIDEVQIGKTEIVNQSDILELYPSTSINEVGGMGNLKEWVSKRARCYSDDATEYGIEPPKGIVLVGPPGTGKSLVAKAISAELGVPLIRMDFSRVFSSYVGSSEQRIRKALKQVEAMAPCVLFCDEIDKGLGGIAGGGGGDSGISQRVLGSFLTWLQDCKAPVFSMVTANNVTGLPPELLRRGRFDAIFSTSLPEDDERREVLYIHLRKRGRSLEDYDEADIQAVVDASKGYVPAEIESAVKDALIDAYGANREVKMSDVVKALRVMVPLSKAFAKQIGEMNEWAKANATPVSIDTAAEAVAEVAVRNRVRTSSRRRA